jgi:hypothetical protein
VEHAAAKAQSNKDQTLSHLKGVCAAKRIATLQAIEVQATQEQQRLVIEAAREKTAAERVAADQAVQMSQKLTTAAQTESDEAHGLADKREDLEAILNSVTTTEKELAEAETSKQTLLQQQAKATEAAKLMELEQIAAAEKHASEQKRQASTKCQAEAMQKIAAAAAGADNSTDAGMIAAQAFVERKAAEQAAFAAIYAQRLQAVEAASRQKEAAITVAGAGAVQLAIQLQTLQSRHEQLTEKAGTMRRSLAAACAAALAQTKTAVEDAERVAEEHRLKMITDFNTSSKARVLEGHDRLIGRRAAGEVSAYGLERLQLFEAGEAVDKTRVDSITAAKEHCAREDSRLRRNLEHMLFEAGTESEAMKGRLAKDAVAEAKLQREVAKLKWWTEREYANLDNTLRTVESDEIVRVQESVKDHLERAIELLKAEAKTSEAQQVLQARATRLDKLELAQQSWAQEMGIKVSEAEQTRNMAFAVAKLEAQMQVTVSAAKNREAKEVKHAERKVAQRLQRGQEQAASEAQQHRREGFRQVETQLVNATSSAQARFQDALSKARTQVAEGAHKKMAPMRAAAIEKGRETKLMEAEQRKAEEELVNGKEAVETATVRAQAATAEMEVVAREQAAAERTKAEANARNQATKLIAEATSAVLDCSAAASDAFSPTKAGCDIAAVMSKVVETRKEQELAAMHCEERAVAAAKVAGEESITAALKPYEEALEKLEVAAAVAAEISESARAEALEAQELAKTTLMEAQAKDEQQLGLVTEELGKILEQEQAEARRSAQQELEKLKLEADESRQTAGSIVRERSAAELLEAKTAAAQKRNIAEKTAFATMELNMAELKGEGAGDAAAGAKRGVAGADSADNATNQAACEAKPATWGSWLFGSGGTAAGSSDHAVEGNTQVVETANLDIFESNVEEAHVQAKPTALRQQPKIHQMLSFDNDIVRSGGMLKGAMVIVLPTAVPASSVRIRWSGLETVGEQQTSILAEETVLWLPEEDTANAMLPAGCHHFSFSWQLPQYLPRSHSQVESNDSTPAHSIVYTAQAIVISGDKVSGGLTVQPVVHELVVREWINPQNTHIWPLGQQQQQQQPATQQLVESDSANEATLDSIDGFAISRGSAERSESAVAVTEAEASASVAMAPLSLSKPVERSATQTYMFGGGQPCVASVQLCTPTLVPGKSSRVTLHVLNGSTRSIASFKYRLLAVTSLMDEALGDSILERLQGGESTDSSDPCRGSSTVIERRSVVVGAFHPNDVTTGKAVRAIGPMQSHGMEFELRIPADVQSSVLHGRRISVRHMLAVEMSNQGVDISTLTVQLPVCVMDEQPAICQDPQV